MARLEKCYGIETEEMNLWRKILFVSIKINALFHEESKLLRRRNVLLIVDLTGSFIVHIPQ